tara:strand:- start:1916 stop:2602 length:687 start_codon:yes stop_codon:yes gene_type:complete
MIVHDCAQGSSEWWDLRLGIPTVSQLSKIITPKALKYSAGAKSFTATLIAERALGRPLDWGQSMDTIWTERGTSMEDEARTFYEFYRDCDVVVPGFCTLDGGGFGGSPDGLVGDFGGVEIKCRAAQAHQECLNGTAEIADRLQVQGYLWLTGRSWWDVLAYNDAPELRNKIQRVYPDGAVHTAIEEGLDRFMSEMTEVEARLAEYGPVIEEDDQLLHELRESVKAGAS